MLFPSFLFRISLSKRLFEMFDVRLTHEIKRLLTYLAMLISTATVVVMIIPLSLVVLVAMAVIVAIVLSKPTTVLWGLRLTSTVEDHEVFTSLQSENNFLARVWSWCFTARVWTAGEVKTHRPLRAPILRNRFR